MTIEELKELKKIVDDAVISSYADFTLEEGYNLVCLIEAEQQRRSVKSEDVQEAIELIKEQQDGWYGSKTWDLYQLAITALQQMQKEPCVKRLSCWYCTGIESHSISTIKTVTDEFGRELSAYDTPYSYCPNCGRKLKED